MKKVVLYEDRCIGCGACMSIAPENFVFGDDGISKLISEEATNEAIEASECCPVSAIEIITDDYNEKCKCGENCHCNDECECDDECNCGEDCNCKKN